MARGIPLTPAERRLRAMLEDQLSETIAGRPDLNRPNGIAQRAGWHVAVRRRTVLPRASSRRHEFAGDVGMRGFPDLVLVHPWQCRLIFAELKRETEQPTEHQVAWLDHLARLPGEVPLDDGRSWRPAVEVYLWRPRHLDVLPTLLGPRFAELDPELDLGVWSVTAA